MTDGERPPWWLSENPSPEPREASEPREPSEPRERSDRPAVPGWASLLGSLGSVAGEWWAASGVGEHVNHADPADHPDCIVCRALATFATTSSEPRSLPATRWLPLRRL